MAKWLFDKFSFMRSICLRASKYSSLAESSIGTISAKTVEASKDTVLNDLIILCAH